jgi:hypothetical protein
MIDARQSEVRNALRVFSTLSRIATYRHGARVGEDSVSFDQVIAGAAGQVVLDLAPYRRCVGMPPGMRHTAPELPTKVPGHSTIRSFQRTY